MVNATIHQAETRLKTPEIERLVDLLERLPAEERAEAWRGVALNLVDRLDEAPRVNK